ncbi:MAG: hypothetical protein QXH27_03420 [Candidatus Micrarchaeia archaeon]
MVCYTVPLAAWVLTQLGRRAVHKNDEHGRWLSLLLLGGATFGVVDHLWHGELFLIGPDIASDLLLGVAITVVTVVVWGVVVALNRAAEPRPVLR